MVSFSQFSLASNHCIGHPFLRLCNSVQKWTRIVSSNFWFFNFFHFIRVYIHPNVVGVCLLVDWLPICWLRLIYFQNSCFHVWIFETSIERSSNILRKLTWYFHVGTIFRIRSNFWRNGWTDAKKKGVVNININVRQSSQFSKFSICSKY